MAYSKWNFTASRNFTERSEVVEERIDKDKQPSPIDPKSLITNNNDKRRE